MACPAGLHAEINALTFKKRVFISLPPVATETGPLLLVIALDRVNFHMCLVASRTVDVVPVVGAAEKLD